VDPRRPAPDVVLLKSANPVAVAAAYAAERRGALVVNGAAASARANDKAAAIAALAAHGVPVPETVLLPAAAVLPPDLASPCVAKPVHGLHGSGVCVAPTAAEALAASAAVNGRAVHDDGTRIVQRVVGRGRVDVKVYAAGAQVFAGGKRFHAGSYRSNEIRPVVPTPAMRELAVAAGGALGLTLVGVDLRHERGDLYVVDVNPFPGYRGFPDAASAIRTEIERRAAA
jgi:ribosomal protein S6--L-glutamate ligase